MKVDICELKNIVEKMNMAVEKSAINPRAGLVEMVENNDDILSIYVGNFDYFLESSIKCVDEENTGMHVTVNSDTFIPLVAKLDDGIAEFACTKNVLTISTSNSEYTFPLVKEAGVAKSVDKIYFDEKGLDANVVSGNDLSSIASINAKGLIDSLFSREIQQYIYVDNCGAITFTENIYINDFVDDVSLGNRDFKFLLNGTQAKLMKIFEKSDKVYFKVLESEYDSPIKVKFYCGNDLNSMSLVLLTQPRRTVDKFPSIRLRDLSNAVSNTHVIIDKKKFEKALQRLMVFDKKFDITVLNYSKLVFGLNNVKLVSIKNNNFEIVEYVSSENAIDHEAIIRFADIVNQLKAVQGKKLDISYGNSPAITINSYRLKQLIPEVKEKG